MNTFRWALAPALTIWCFAPAHAESLLRTSFNLESADCACATDSYDSSDEASCSDSCDCGDGCDNSYGCGDACGDSCCGGNSCGCRRYGMLADCFCCCDLGEACSLRDNLIQNECCTIDFGFWTQMGYHSENTRQSVAFNDLLSFNDVPDQLNLHQQWMYVEKAAEAPCCGLDWGFRFDVMYGTDAQKTQAFGNPGANIRNQGTWDASLDHGEYGWAMPQLYGEVAWGDWSVIAGHFFTLVGYEVVTAPDNFFYSHALTMFNSEPFTHTGALATYSGYDDLSIYAGWTLGWDTGFDQNFSGSSWLGGFGWTVSDDVTFTYISTAGNFGARSAGENGYSHSLVWDVTLTDKVNYVLQSDLVHYEDPAISGFNAQVGVNQYLFYAFNDCWKLGGRLEWWKSNGLTNGVGDDSASFYEITGGINYKPHANVVVRPEIRYDWTPSETAFAASNPGVQYNQATFGIDVIFTY